MGDDDEGVSVGGEVHGGDLAAAGREFDCFLLDLLPVAEADDLDLVLSGERHLVEGVIDGHGLEGSVEHALALDLVLHLLLVGRHVAVVPLSEPHHDVSVPVELVVDDLSVLRFEHEFEGRRPVLGDIVDEQCLLVEDAADGGLFLISLFGLHGHPLEVARLGLDCEGVGGVIGVVVGDGDEFVL